MKTFLFFMILFCIFMSIISTGSNEIIFSVFTVIFLLEYNHKTLLERIKELENEK